MKYKLFVQKNNERKKRTISCPPKTYPKQIEN